MTNHETRASAQPALFADPHVRSSSLTKAIGCVKSTETGPAGSILGKQRAQPNMVRPAAMDGVAALEKMLDELTLDTQIREPWRRREDFKAQDPEPWRRREGFKAQEPRQDFKATHEWQVLPPNVICPPGLQFEVDLTNNRTLARLPPSASASETIE